MVTDFGRGTELLKALADENRAKIIQILSCGELCACKIQEHFRLTQPTLSHHLAILVDADLVAARKEGKWMYYRLNPEAFDFVTSYLKKISSGSADCPCNEL